MLSSISNKNNNSNRGQIKVSNNTPIHPAVKDQEDSSQDDDLLLLNVDVDQIKPINFSTQKPEAAINSFTNTDIKTLDREFSNKSTNNQNNNMQSEVWTAIPEKNYNKIKESNEPINYEICCIKKRPSNVVPGEANYSLCIHIINGYVKDFTNKLVQSKLKWSQECIISDLKCNEYQAYLGNDPIENLLDLTCVQAKDIFKKSKEIDLPPSENKFIILFEKKKNEYFKKVNEIKFVMYLKFDFDRKMFCVFKIENIQGI